MAPPPLRPDAVDEIRRVYAETRDRRETARRCRRDQGTVLKYTRDMGGPAAGPRPDAARRRCHELLAGGLSTREVARQLRAEGFKASGTSVQNWAREPLPESAEGCPDVPDTAEGGPPLPESWAEEYPAFAVAGPAKVLLMNDIHIPFHVTAAVEAAVAHGRRFGADVVFLNGDVFDFHGVSRYDHDGTKLTYTEEIEYGRQFMAYLRGKFPKARLIVKAGNHEERLDRYILSRAPALFGLENVTLRSLVGMDGFGAECVGDQRLVKLGKLHAIHGHEYGSGSSAPVNAARWLMLRARRHATMGHLHHTSEQIEQDIGGQQLATWSVGCLCGLSPKYRRLNSRWNHGLATVEVSADGSFSFDNKRIIDGKVV